MIWFCLLGAAALFAAYRWQFWRLPHKGLLCLMYHHIGPCDPADGQFPFTVSVPRFEQQLAVLRRHGFTPVGLEEVSRAAQTGQKIPARPVLLSFDDGHLDNYTHLFPLLKKYRVPALIFLVTDFIGQKPDYLTWPQVQEMQQSGLVEFGSHSCSHARLRKMSDEEIRREITQSKKEIEQRLGVPCRAFCYPFGSGGLDKRVRSQVLAAGYQYDFSTKPGINPWPYKGKSTLLRAFPRGGEGLMDFYVQITRGKSKF